MGKIREAEERSQWNRVGTCLGLFHVQTSEDTSPSHYHGENVIRVVTILVSLLQAHDKIASPYAVILGMTM